MGSQPAIITGIAGTAFHRMRCFPVLAGFQTRLLRAVPE